MKLALLPGFVGSCKELYGSEFDGTGEEVVRIEWPALDGEPSIEDLADACLATEAIHDADTLVGSSIGGMVAAEVVRREPGRRLILVGSALHKSEVNEILGPLATLPEAVLADQLKTLVALDIYPERDRILEVLEHSDAKAARALCAAIFRWKGAPDVPVTRRIHGAWDLVIPRPQDPSIVTFERAGHMLALTHGESVARAIRAALETA